MTRLWAEQVHRAQAVLFVAMATVALAGCGSDTHHTVVTNRMVTQDQELQDLQRALNAGAISPTEYDQQRHKVLLNK